MRCSVNVPNFGEVAAPEVFAEVARRAEEAGWDALLVGDSVAGEKDLRAGRDLVGPLADLGVTWWDEPDALG